MSEGRWTRREWLGLGTLGAFGLSMPTLLRTASGAVAPPAPGFGRARSCIVLFLTGGPSQLETFDPKPEAASDIRGRLGTVRTSIPGVHFGELLPRTARIADRLTVIRSMQTMSNSHSASGYAMLTGHPHPTPALEIGTGPEDWPALAASVAWKRPGERSPFSSVVLPERIFNNPGVPWPGQTGGFMGPTWDPPILTCDPSEPKFRVEGLSLPDQISPQRMVDRTTLLEALDGKLRSLEREDRLVAHDRFRQKALEILGSSETCAAFELQREPAKARDRYGRSKFGQSVLLARRLIEAGVRLVQVNFPRQPGDLSSGNPLWDTHSDNERRMKEDLCPPFDLAFPALIEDLEDRGLLAETLVLVMGEFGRSPKINPNGGRDHWGNCFSILMAGGGAARGLVVGSSDRMGAYPADRAVKPQDLAATVLHALGIDPMVELVDPLGRPRPVLEGGAVVKEIFA